MSKAAPYRPLAGLRVVDLADEKAELCGRLLADLGADVVRVDPPGGGASRTLPPFFGDVSLAFEVRNVNKRAVTIDLREPVGRTRLLDMLRDADIWIETSRPGTLAAVGLDPREVTRRFRHLVTVSVTDFGQTGPYRDHQATDAVMEGLSWMLFRAGVPELPPVLPPGPFAYDMVGVSAAFAALTAYLDRCNTGTGQYIDMSVMEAIAQTTDWGLTSYSVVRQFGTYGEIRDGGGKVYPTLPCLDGHIRIAMVTLAEWRRLRSWIGESGVGSEIIEQDYWEDQRTRLELFNDLLRPILIEFFKDKTMMDLATEGQNRGVPITPMLTPADALRTEQFQALGSFTSFDDGAGLVPSGFFVVDGQRVGPWAHEPQPGASVSPVIARDPAAPAGLPYSGLRVVEFGVAGAVPEMARLLAEYGAGAIRVESPKRPDIFRQLGGPTGMGGVFASSNRSTRSFGVDFTEPAGAEVTKDLLKCADVVLENLPPGTLERFGLGLDDIRAINPSALIISSQSMGRRGPWAHWRGYGSNTQLPSGMSWLWSFPDAPAPVPQNVAFPDHLVGRLGAAVTAADLIGRRAGHPAAGHVEIVQAEMALNLLADLVLKESLEPGSIHPVGNRSPRGAPWGVYPCSGEQRWCVITCRDDRDWAGLVRAMGAPSWACSPALDDAADRTAAQDMIDEQLSVWTREQRDREVMELLQAEGVPAGMMMYASDQPNDPHLQERGYILEIDQPGVGKILLEGPAFYATGLPNPITFPAPLLGQHTREIATQILGYSNQRVDELLASGLLVENLPFS